jgi:hypothetical protein
MEASKKLLEPSLARQLFRLPIRFIVIGFYLFMTTNTFGQAYLACNYKAGGFSMTLEGHSSGNGFTSRIVLTDNNGVIKYVTTPNSTSFQNVIAGSYLAYGITYENATYIPNLTVNENINLVGACYKTVVVPTKVCDCNNQNGNLFIPAITPPVGKQISYVLTNGKGVILLVSQSPVFNGNPDGVYNIIPILYPLGTYPTNLELGKNINTVTCTDLQLLSPVGFVVCTNQKPILSLVKSAPTTAVIGDIFTYSLSLQNTGNLATTGIVTISDTLAQGLSFESLKTNSSPGWSCQANIIVVNNTVRTLVSCNTSNQISINQVQTVNFGVIAQRTGSFFNQAYVKGGLTTTETGSNVVNTIIVEKEICQEVCVPYVIIKTNKNVK